MSTATAVKIPTGATLNGGPNPSRGAKVPDAIGTPAGRQAKGTDAIGTPAGRQAKGTDAIGTPCAEQLSEGELRALRGLMRAHASLAKRLDAELEQAHGLPLSSYEVLVHLEGAPDGRMRMCDLAERCPALTQRPDAPGRPPGARRPARRAAPANTTPAAPSPASPTQGVQLLSDARGDAPRGGARAVPLALLRAPSWARWQRCGTASRRAAPAARG